MRRSHRRRAPLLTGLAGASTLPAMLSPRALVSHLGLAWLALAALFFAMARPVAAQHGCTSGNLIPNCDFNAFAGSPPRQVPEGWTPFILLGDVEYRQVIGEEESHSWYAPSSLKMSSSGAYLAGIYTQVSGLQPGAGYKASWGWGAPGPPTQTYGRQLGIDPTGGTDPAAPTVVWGHEHWGDGRMLNYPPPDVNVDVSVIAQSSTVTVFAKVNHNAATADAKIYVDAISLTFDPDMPTPVPATATPVPPTRAPRPTAAPTATPLPTATPTATPTPTVTPTPTASPTSTASPTPTQTYTPTVTPTSTLPPRPMATLQPDGSTQARADTPSGYLFGGVGALLGAGMLGAGAAAARRR